VQVRWSRTDVEYFCSIAGPPLAAVWAGFDGIAQAQSLINSSFGGTALRVLIVNANDEAVLRL